MFAESVLKQFLRVVLPVPNYTWAGRITILSMFGLIFNWSLNLSAQSSLSDAQGKADRAATINFAELARQEIAEVVTTGQSQASEPPVPAAIAITSLDDSSDFSPPSLLSDSALHLLSTGFTPVLRNSFSGLIDDHTAIPPDTQGAAGPEHLMVVLNTQVAVQNRQGQILSKVALWSFWSRVGHTNVFDPKVLYDPLAGRFVVAALANRRSAASALLIGMSRTSDPTGDWDLFAFDIDAQDNVWGDYTNLGLNNNWVVVTANIIGIQTNNFIRSDIFVFDKKKLGPGSNPQFTRFSETNIFTVVPAVTFDVAESSLYFVTELGTNQLRISKLAGAVGQETYATNVAVTPTVEGWSFTPGNTNFAPQAGTDVRVFVNDSRMQSVVNRNGSLWCTHTVFLFAGTNVNRSAVQWWQLSTTGAVLQRGRIDNSSGQTHYAFPSLTVNKFNDMLIGYSRFSANQFVSANYSYRLSADAPSTLRSDTVLKNGVASYVRPNSGNRNSWGDYSATMVDPLNDIDMWTIQEYAEAPDASGDRWGTWWGWVGFQSAVPPQITTPPQSQTVPTLGANVALNVAASGTAPLIYQWRYNGTSIPGATSANLALNNFQLSNVGKYSVFVTNVAGFATSAEATVAFAWPTITTQPQSQSVAAGSNVTLSVTAMGTAPLSYQWRFNQADIPTSTNTSLVLANFQAPNAGNYSVVVSNFAGAVTSASAVLTLQTVAAPQFSEPKFLPNGFFQFWIKSDIGSVLEIQTSVNLADWAKYFVFTNNNTAVFLNNPPLANSTQRFYRILVRP